MIRTAAFGSGKRPAANQLNAGDIQMDRAEMDRSGFLDRKRRRPKLDFGKRPIDGLDNAEGQ